MNIKNGWSVSLAGLFLALILLFGGAAPVSAGFFDSLKVRLFGPNTAETKEKIADHGNNIVDRLAERVSDLQDLVDQTGAKIDELYQKGKDTSYLSEQLGLAVQKLEQAETDLEAVRAVLAGQDSTGISAGATLMTVTATSESPAAISTTELRSAIKVAEESIRETSSILAGMKKNLKESSLKNRRNTFTAPTRNVQ